MALLVIPLRKDHSPPRLSVPINSAVDVHKIDCATPTVIHLFVFLRAIILEYCHSHARTLLFRQFFLSIILVRLYKMLHSVFDMRVIIRCHNINFFIRNEHLHYEVGQGI